MPGTLESCRFGPLSYCEEEILHFPEGLPGFEEMREFLLLSPPGAAPLQYLLALRDPEIGFLVLEARTCLPGYTPALEEAHLRGLGTDGPAVPGIYVIVNLHHDREEVTANLRAPVLINPGARLGRQVILAETSYALHHRLLGD
jgi:flagellar assembly factor FliW